VKARTLNRDRRARSANFKLTVYPLLAYRLPFPITAIGLLARRRQFPIVVNLGEDIADAD
jgi:hypothetical protein